MEASTICENLKYLAENGVTLSIDERMHLELALVQLQEKLCFEELQFWGKISGKHQSRSQLNFHNARNFCLKGIENDYFVAVGVNYIGHKDLP